MSFGLIQSPDFPQIENGSLDAYLDQILPEIHPFSEDVRETEFYTSMQGKSWMLFSDDPAFREMVCYYFYPLLDNNIGRFEKTINGHGLVGIWTKLDNVNRIVIEIGKKGQEMRLHYDLKFLSENYMILKLNSLNAEKSKYLALGYEGHVKGLSWFEYVEALFYENRPTSRFNLALLMIVLILLAIGYLSL